MNSHTLIVTLTLLITVFFDLAAQKQLREANTLFERLAYSEAIPKYENIVKNDSSLFEAKQRLAESYRLTGNYAEAEKWLAKVVQDKNASLTDRFHYGQMLMNNGKYEEAKKWLAIVTEEKPEDERPRNYLNSIESIHRFFADSLRYKITPLPVNGPGNDFSPAFYKEGIVFTSSTKIKKIQKQHAWTGESFTGLVFFNPTEQQTYPFAEAIKAKYNNGPASFTKSGELYNTINVIKVKDAKKDSYKLSIIHAQESEKGWIKIDDFPFNDPSYNTAHPAVSQDGTEIYFSSDRSGGEGGMDLYYSKREAGSWTPPINLGKEVNTPGNDVFPFLHQDGTLYFSSNGHEGLGGLDILTTRKKNGQWEVPVAFGFPINSGADDFSFIVNEAKSDGYFSSNRPEGKGGDDIYHFRFTPSHLEINVINERNERVGNVPVTLVELSTGKEKSITTDEQGKFQLQVSACHEYELVSSTGRYHKNTTRFKSPCVRSSSDVLTVTLRAPRLTFSVINKYTLQNISGVLLRIIDPHTNAVLAAGLADSLTLPVEPCYEYVIISTKEGLSELKTKVRTACIVKDDVVTISTGNPPVDPTLIAGTVYDQDSDHALDSVAVILFDKTNKPVATLTTTSGGQFAIAGFKNIDRIAFFKHGYFSVTKVLADEKNAKEIRVKMPNLALDKIIQLEGVFYNVGKFNIRPDAAKVLDNVVKVMQENESLEIELSAHTDSRGRDEGNLALSDKRAKAAAAYIISKGISESRVQGKGYGETMLKNRCSNGVRCSEQEHQENRRTEVRIAKY